VTGAISVVALIKGPEKIEDLGANYKLITGILVATAALLALRGIVLAALAAQGTPGRIEYTGTALRDFTLDEADEAADLLRFSRVVTVVATLVAGAAVGFIWFAPQDKSAPSMRLVIRDNGTLVCGELKTGTGDTVTIDDQPIPVNEIRSITAVSECPTA